MNKIGDDPITDPVTEDKGRMNGENQLILNMSARKALSQRVPQYLLECPSSPLFHSNCRPTKKGPNSSGSAPAILLCQLPASFRTTTSADTAGGQCFRSGTLCHQCGCTR